MNKREAQTILTMADNSYRSLVSKISSAAEADQIAWDKKFKDLPAIADATEALALAVGRTRANTLRNAIFKPDGIVGYGVHIGPLEGLAGDWVAANPRPGTVNSRDYYERKRPLLESALASTAYRWEAFGPYLMTFASDIGAASSLEEFDKAIDTLTTSLTK